MRRVIALLALVLGSLFLTSPANAVYSSTWTERHCHSYGRAGLPGATVTSCLTVGWRTQDDGVGIRVEDVKFDGDCSQLENNGYRGYMNGYVHVGHTWDPGGAGPVWREPATSTPYFNCGQWYDAELKLDENSNRVTITGSAFLRVDGSWDFTDSWNGFDICKDNTC